MSVIGVPLGFAHARQHHPTNQTTGTLVRRGHAFEFPKRPTFRPQRDAALLERREMLIQRQGHVVRSIERRIRARAPRFSDDGFVAWSKSARGVQRPCGMLAFPARDTQLARALSVDTENDLDPTSTLRAEDQRMDELDLMYRGWIARPHRLRYGQGQFWIERSRRPALAIHTVVLNEARGVLIEHEIPGLKSGVERRLGTRTQKRMDRPETI